MHRRIVISVTLLVLLLALAPVGYMTIEHMSYTEALYMTVITITTVGFREVRPLSTAGMYFTILVILTGVFNLFFIISGLISYTFGEALREIFGRRRMDLRIRKLRDHHVVCGFGRVGEVVCDTLAEAGADFVVIERDPARLVLAQEKGYLCLEGDATSTETLVNAGVGRARGVVCALENDADNLFTTLSARSLNQEVIIVTRCVSRDSVDKLLYAGADRVISPYTLSGKRMATFLLKPSVFDYLDLVAHGISLDYRLEELEVEEGSELAGRTIGEMDIRVRTGALVVAVRKAADGRFDTRPDKDTRLDAGDLLIALGTPRDLSNLENMSASRR
ncbi:potassium channel protein [Candidatus Solincola tengchongensis]|uniref:potassium channel family protein n=1 Tax=Candidatus Solincola tengchongensis TaxID=2900693 RepID=UPI00257E4D1A|nr:potassium channel protein [Candidatus Solincola tengchongensis]